MSNQHQRPLYDALVAYKNSDAHPFDVPGHKMGKGIHPDFIKEVGMEIFKMDINSMPSMDNLSNPEGVIKQAESLAAALFQVDNAFFLVNGSTSGIQNMILATIKPGDKLILPRNIHKSAINGLVLSGGIPVYIHPTIEPVVGIAVGQAFRQTKKVIDENLDAKAILLLNPTYYGFTSNLKQIIEYAHKKGLIVLVDESHGSHFYMDHRFGVPSMSLGADMATISLHKTGGSLTQSSLLLHNEGRISKSKVQSTINIMQTSSASYLLMSSIDMARHNLANNGGIMDHVYNLGIQAKEKIQAIKGYRLMEETIYVNKQPFHHDVSKLLIDVSGLGKSGNEIFDLLKEEFNIQIEVGESRIILAIISIGDNQLEIDYLIEALNVLSERFYVENPKSIGRRKYFQPIAHKSPREAFFSDTEYIPIKEADGRICADQIMIYPPGIPLLVPGEVITAEIIKEYIRLIKQGNKTIGTTTQNKNIKIKVIKE
jgi:arginine/lysine/ornithine decarboxylase